MINAIKRTPLLLLLAALVLLGCSARRQSANEAERDRNFQQMMSGVVLIGHSVTGEGNALSGEERFAIDKVSKLTGDTWLFQTRLNYHSREIPAPIPLTIKWAGDTPVITMTDLSIPGLGTYTARVLLYRNQYAGTWSAKDAGGQLFGKIVRQSQQQAFLHR
jgi:hypothetical protein